MRTATPETVISISDLPPLTTSGGATYSIKHVYLYLLGYFFGQSGAFFGCFFGIRGPNGEWPEAWWAFALLANAFILTHSQSRSMSAKIVRHADSIEYFNIWGRSIYGEIPLEKYESVGLKKGLCSNVVIVKTDEYVQELKARYRWCSCCICKYSSYAVREIDQFASDHGLDEKHNAESSNV